MPRSCKSEGCPEVREAPLYPGVPPSTPRAAPGTSRALAREKTPPERFPSCTEASTEVPWGQQAPQTRPPSLWASPPPLGTKPSVAGHGGAGAASPLERHDNKIPRLCGRVTYCYLFSSCFGGHFYCSFRKGPNLSGPLPWRGSLSREVERRSRQAPRRKPHQGSLRKGVKWGHPKGRAGSTGAGCGARWALEETTGAAVPQAWGGARAGGHRLGASAETPAHQQGAPRAWPRAVTRLGPNPKGPAPNVLDCIRLQDSCLTPRKRQAPQTALNLNFPPAKLEGAWNRVNCFREVKNDGFQRQSVGLNVTPVYEEELGSAFRLSSNPCPSFRRPSWELWLLLLAWGLAQSEQQGHALLGTLGPRGPKPMWSCPITAQRRQAPRLGPATQRGQEMCGDRGVPAGVCSLSLRLIILNFSKLLPHVILRNP